MRRRNFFGNDTIKAMEMFKSEIRILKSLEHEHIVKFVGSYTDKTYLGIVTSPVADMDLASFMKKLCIYLRAGSSTLGNQNATVPAEMSASLRTFFGCVATALTFLHDNRIRHKDIKPQNILIAQGAVLFTDFGLSRHFADGEGSTTSGLTPATPRYRPPEVAAYEPRNTSADIWSLGCVFLEMVAALRGYDLDWIREYFLNAGSKEPHYSSNLPACAQLLQYFETEATPPDQKPLKWIRTMINNDRSARPTASSLLNMITYQDDSDQPTTTFCGICCLPGLESDSCDSLLDEPTVAPPPTPGRHESSDLSPPNDISDTISTQILPPYLISVPRRTHIWRDLTTRNHTAFDTDSFCEPSPISSDCTSSMRMLSTLDSGVASIEPGQKHDGSGSTSTLKRHLNQWRKLETSNSNSNKKLRIAFRGTTKASSPDITNCEPKGSGLSPPLTIDNTIELPLSAELAPKELAVSEAADSLARRESNIPNTFVAFSPNSKFKETGSTSNNMESFSTKSEPTFMNMSRVHTKSFTSSRVRKPRESGCGSREISRRVGESKRDSSPRNTGISEIRIPEQLPNSFLMACRNRLTRDMVLSFCKAMPETKSSRSTRLTRRKKSFEDPFFVYGDGMLPTNIFADTCVKSKASPFATWTTLRHLIEHMTPALLRGYSRRLPDPSLDLADSPTVVSTQYLSDEVHGMIIFGMHHSQQHNILKYGCDYEDTRREFVEAELDDGTAIAVEACVQVWNVGRGGEAKPYNNPWDPIEVVKTDYYARNYRLLIHEEEALVLEPNKAVLASSR
ncbi:kinase-like protein [Zopfia rhizophila CBS 207.26]|uniref:non-specific serine/threonine protein kinase n=1 Tax=Zopfia rhizophila CBS 207.26 TaxID=1314779 RepID=A0A6A6EVD8_9PEZI|nr:kinase-like protein [Zopfia rhizophila CBS 207.26]